jgi:2-polyprenyl-3-methyl-5-hydroxy-6-metoxy-1,4-benzoquinol methylase
LNPEYAAAYGDLYRRHWWWRARESMLVREIQRHQPLSGWGNLLDVGCGDGLFFDQLARFGEVWGVESDESLVPADSRRRDRIHVGAFDASFSPNRRFGLVLMLDVLEHLRDPVGALEHARCLLRPGGRVLITVPAFPLLWTHHDDLNQHFVRYRKRSLAAVLEPAGLRMMSSHYCFHWLFPIKLAVRGLERLGGKDGAPATVPPSWLNRLFFALTRAEQTTVGRLDLPFGSSLLAWCAAAA